MTALGDFIMNGRKECGLSLRAAAKLAGVSEGLWRQVERGYQKNGAAQIPANPKPRTVVSMAVAVQRDPQRALDLAGLKADARKVRRATTVPYREDGLTPGEWAYIETWEKHGVPRDQTTRNYIVDDLMPRLVSELRELRAVLEGLPAHITVHYYELSGLGTEELFDRVADAAHALDEQVMVSMEDCQCHVDEAAGRRS